MNIHVKNESMQDVSQPLMFIDGVWSEAADRASVEIKSPATGKSVGWVPKATAGDLERALETSASGFGLWSEVSALDRSRTLRKAAALVRCWEDDVATAICLQQGKPLAEARVEWRNCADIFEWAAEEGRRAYGRLIPPRSPRVVQSVRVEPVGPVAAFTPWNFPASQAAKKLAFALAAGCSILLKGPEEAPAGCVGLVRALDEAGVPKGVVSLLFGDPALISSHLIASPIVRKISFTGSVPVGKRLAALAATYMKPCTLELGGHAPVLVFDDVDPEHVATILVSSKFRNAGQVCIAPTRFYVQSGIYERFVKCFVEVVSHLKMGDGFSEGTNIGPLANQRRVEAVGELVEDAVARGGVLLIGGRREPGIGSYFQPTVLASVPEGARIWKEEPFGPVALMDSFSTLSDALEKANSTDYGLASYVFTNSAELGERASRGLKAGMVSINHFGLGVIEAPFGGVHDSGYGREGGIEGLSSYTTTKFVTHCVTAL